MNTKAKLPLVSHQFTYQDKLLFSIGRKLGGKNGNLRL